MENITTATGVQPMSVLPMTVLPMTPVRSCTSWERAHASTLVVSTGGVRPDAVDGRQRQLATSGKYISAPSSGTSTLSPPV